MARPRPSDDRPAPPYKVRSYITWPFGYRKWQLWDQRDKLHGTYRTWPEAMRAADPRKHDGRIVYLRGGGFG